MSKISLCLWFNGQAEEAATFYTSLLPNSEITGISRYASETRGFKAGCALMVQFTLAGQSYSALNGGPEFAFTEAMSFVVPCADQAEVDRLWQALTADGGKPSRCGWLKDKFGVSWQIVPEALATMMKDPDPAKTSRVMKAFMPMTKLDIATLESAYRGD